MFTGFNSKLEIVLHWFTCSYSLQVVVEKKVTPCSMDLEVLEPPKRIDEEKAPHEKVEQEEAPPVMAEVTQPSIPKGQSPSTKVTEVLGELAPQEASLVVKESLIMLKQWLSKEIKKEGNRKINELIS